jgi:xanthine/uracil permease
MDKLVLVIVVPSFVVVIKIVVVLSRVDAGCVEICVVVFSTVVGCVVVLEAKLASFREVIQCDLLESAEIMSAFGQARWKLAEHLYIFRWSFVLKLAGWTSSCS